MVYGRFPADGFHLSPDFTKRIKILGLPALLLAEEYAMVWAHKATKMPVPMKDGMVNPASGVWGLHAQVLAQTAARNKPLRRQYVRALDLCMQSNSFSWLTDLQG